MKPKHRKWIVIPGILVVAFAIAAGLAQLKPEPPKNEDQELDPLVEVIVLEVSTESFRIDSQGTVKPRTQTVVSAEVLGSVVSISPKFVAGGMFKAPLWS